MNEYEILNIPETATREEIRAAYRDLARRWHPDRFMAEYVEVAQIKSAAINAAYRACLDGTRQGGEPSKDGESEALLRVQALIDDGKYQTARKLLMGFDTRCAEWNYLFGAVLLKLRDTEKAMIYLSVATHQAPGCIKYARALKEAQQTHVTRRLNNLFSRRVRMGGR